MSISSTFSLSQMLREMDQALEDEIEVKSRNRQYIHSAVGGTLISEENGQFIYQFKLTEPWDAQDDTPLLIVNSPESIKCTVVNSTGTIITIAADIALPPELLQQINLSDDSTELLERQRDALKEANEGNVKLASKCFGLLPYQQTEMSSDVSFGEFRLRESQLRAVEMSLGGEISYIIGPPGTGKTMTLAAIAFQHLRAGRTVLIAAQTNIAIDNAIMKLCQLCKGARRQDLLAQGQVIRYGAVQKQEFKTTHDYDDVYLPRVVERLSADLHRQYEATRIAVDKIHQQQAELSQSYTDQIEGGKKEQKERKEQLDSLLQELNLLKQEEKQRILLLERQQQTYVVLVRNKRIDIENNRQNIARKEVILNGKRRACDEVLLQRQAVEARLDGARSMSTLKRFFKGMNLTRLETQVAYYNQCIYELQHDIDYLQAQIAEFRQSVTARNSELQDIQAKLDKCNQQLQSVTPTATRIDELEKQGVYDSQYLTDLNAVLERRLQQFQQERRPLMNQQNTLENNLRVLDQQLRDVEKSIISKAQVLGATLTKLYVSQTIAERRFDAIIMDEVSMASMPAIYITAARANCSVTLIGDPQQLAPIVSARSDAAKRWLGKDLFDLREISLMAAASGHRHSVMLDVQFRMHPDIADTVRGTVYGGLLKDDFNVNALRSVEPLPASPLVLCNTHDASPVATRPANGHSRINYYHALCCLAIAHSALQSLSEKSGSHQAEPCIGIVTPYRPQAQLLQKMVREAGLYQCIQVGTVHRFQGLEFDCVIFDTVESPGITPGEFVSGPFGSNAMRLINVAATRARHKLFIVANQQYLQQTLSSASTLRLVVDCAAKSAIISSLSIAGVSLASRIEQITKQQPVSVPIASLVKQISPGKETLVLAPTKKAQGDVQSREATPAKSNNYNEDMEHLTEQTFYALFERDLRQARGSVMIASAFITERRVKEILPILLEEKQRGVDVKIFTRPMAEKETWDCSATQLLVQSDISLIYRSMMHEKVAIIDDFIMYYGSLNILSQRNSRESMQRTTGHKVFMQSLKETLLAVEEEQANSYKKRPLKLDHLNEVRIPLVLLPSLSVSCWCGGRLVPRLKRDGSETFNGCTNYRGPAEKKHTTKDISVDQLLRIQELRNRSCPVCGSSLTPEIAGKQTLLRCSNASCDEIQKIIFYKDY